MDQCFCDCIERYAYSEHKYLHIITTEQYLKIYDAKWSPSLSSVFEQVGQMAIP